MRKNNFLKYQSIIEYVLISAVIIAALLLFLPSFKTGIGKALNHTQEALVNSTAKLPQLIKN